jgi:subtilase family serine protease
LWQQAAAQGMSVFISSGDSGSAGCDRDDPAQFGLQVSGFASTPYTTTVGGTDFNDLNNFTPYWNLTNDAHEASAKSYIPEMTWNDSCTNAEWSTVTGSTNAETNCNTARLLGAVVATGGSGGKSSCTTGSGVDIISCTGGYPKPSWQTGTGVPNDGKRDIPDVSLFASNGFNGNFYVICSKNITDSYCDPGNPNGTIVGIGGTSASTPAFAGIMALIDQKTNSRQGNPNYTLYRVQFEHATRDHMCIQRRDVRRDCHAVLEGKYERLQDKCVRPSIRRPIRICDNSGLRFGRGLRFGQRCESGNGLDDLGGWLER